MTTISGILHVHSRFSYDGRHTLDEIAGFARRRGYRFVCMSEHSDTLDSVSMSDHIVECARASTDSCLIVPGIEFSIGAGLHLLGFGIRRLPAVRGACEVARFIRSEGGVAVVAHPVRYGYEVSEELAEVVHGIEVWNGGYDGSFVPDDRVLALWRRLKAGNPALLGFGGPDMHGFSEQQQVTVSVVRAATTAERLIGELREGRFVVANGYFALDAREVPSRRRLAIIKAARRLYEAARQARDLVRGR